MRYLVKAIVASQKLTLSANQSDYSVWFLVWKDKRELCPKRNMNGSIVDVILLYRNQIQRNLPFQESNKTVNNNALSECQGLTGR